MKKSKGLVKSLLQFEIIYHLMIWIFIKPIIAKVVQIYLNTKSSVSVNENMLFNLLTLPGIVVGCIISILLFLIVFFELSVIIEVLYQSVTKQQINLQLVIKQVLYKLDRLVRPSSILAIIYYVVFLPTVHIGYINSAIMRIKIPNFIINELKMTTVGRYGIILFYSIILILFILSYMIPIVMVVYKLDFIESFRKQKELLKSMTKRSRLMMIGIIILWAVLQFYMDTLMPQGILKNSDFNRYFFKQIVRLPSFRLEFLRYLIVNVSLFILMCYFIVYILKSANIQTKEEFEYYDFKKLKKVKYICVNSYLKFKNSKFIKKYEKLYWLVVRLVSIYFIFLIFQDWLIMFILGFVILTYKRFQFINDLLICFVAIYTVALQTKDVISTFMTLFLISIMVYFWLCIFKPKWVTTQYFTKLFDLIVGTIQKWSFYKQHPRIVIGICVFLCLQVIYAYFSTNPSLHPPYVIGHRGSNVGVENSIEAIEYGALNGADMLEIDVLLTKDLVPVVIHDQSLSRLSGVNQNVSDLTFEELKEITLYEDGYYSKVSSLEEVIHFLKSINSQSMLLIEVKLSGNLGEVLANKVMELVVENNYESHCAYMSIDYEVTQIIHQQYPDWWVGYCIYGSLGNVNAINMWNMNIDFLAVEENQINSSFLQQAKFAFVPVYVWTVDQSASIRRYLKMGVDGIITNNVQQTRDLVDEYLSQSSKYYMSPSIYNEIN